MYKIFIRVDTGYGGRLEPAFRVGLDHEKVFLEYEEKAEANAKASEIRLSIAYLTNARAEVNAKVIVLELNC